MAVTLTTKMRIASWDETPVEEFDGMTASGRMTIVAGSGTGGLAGITGTCESVSTHADYPFMPLTLAYELA